MPSDSAAMEMRPPSSMRMASMNPSPSWPSRFSAGTTQSSKISSAVSLARSPSLFSFLPGTKSLRVLLHHEGRKPVRVRRAIGHRQHHHHVGIVAVGAERLGAVEHPSRSPAHAVMRALPASEPEPGSVSPQAPMYSPVASLGTYCSSAPRCRPGRCGSSTARCAPPR